MCSKAENVDSIYLVYRPCQLILSMVYTEVGFLPNSPDSLALQPAQAPITRSPDLAIFVSIATAMTMWDNDYFCDNTVHALNTCLNFELAWTKT